MKHRSNSVAPSRARESRRLAPVCGIVMAIALIATGCKAPSGGLRGTATELQTGQAMSDLSDAVNGLREESAMMQAQIDSLRDVVAHQDTVIRQLSVSAGLVPR
jgi:hypothetical protein